MSKICVMIHRIIKQSLLRDLTDLNKVILLYGPRQSGKTTLSKEVISELPFKTLLVNADEVKYLDVLSSRDLRLLRSLVSGYEMLFIDEGHRIPDIGLNLKILHDEIPELKILVTGSSSFLLSGSVTESLAGRKKVYTLLPVSMQELSQEMNLFELNDQLEDRLIFGSYPEVIQTDGFEAKADYLSDVTDSLLFKDILELENIRYPVKIRNLLKLLAYQVGSQVSLHELGKQLALNRETVERYLYLLEQSFIIFSLSALSRNPRKEVSKSQKYFFYDNGIRNQIINDLSLPENRNDMGLLWENFMISERIKYLQFNRMDASKYFWRTYRGTEIDYIEERNGKFYAYEMKAGKSKARAPKTWISDYGNDFQLVNRENYQDFIL